MCAGNPSHCKRLQGFEKILCIRVLVSELPAQCFNDPRLQRTVPIIRVLQSELPNWNFRTCLAMS